MPVIYSSPNSDSRLYLFPVCLNILDNFTSLIFSAGQLVKAFFLRCPLGELHCCCPGIYDPEHFIYLSSHFWCTEFCASPNPYPVCFHFYEASLEVFYAESACKKSAWEMDGLKPCAPEFAFILPSHMIDRLLFWHLSLCVWRVFAPCNLLASFL